MAKRQSEYTDTGLVIEEPVSQAVDANTNDNTGEVSAPIPGTVRLHNLKPGAMEITLLGTESFTLQGFKPGSTKHISEPIPKNKIPDAYKKLARSRNGGIKIVEEVS